MPCVYPVRSPLAGSAYVLERIARSVANVVEIEAGKIGLLEY